MYIANAGTVSSLRLRGYTKPCYNVLEFEGDEVKIRRRFPFGGSNVIAHFSLTTGAQFHRELEPPGPGARSRPSSEAAASARAADERSSPPIRVIVLVDGEHYPPGDPLGDRGRPRARARGRGRAAGRRHGEAPTRRADRGRRAAAPDARRPHDLAGSGDRRAPPEGVLDLSDEPVLGYRERMELAAVTLAAGLPYLGPGLPARPPDRGAAARRSHGRRDRHRQANREDRDRRRAGPARRRHGPGSRSSSRWAAAARPSPRSRRRAPCDLARLLGSSSARVATPPPTTWRTRSRPA